MIFLITWWKAIAGAGVALLIAFALHSLDVGRLEIKHAAALSAQQTTLEAKCRTDKAITEGVSNELQKKLSDRTRQLNALRVRPPRCIPVIADAAAGHDAAPAGEKLPDKNGLPSSVLYDLAADAEKTGLQLDACQGFVKKTWESRK